VFSQFSPVTDIIDRLGDHIAVTTKHDIPAIHLEKNERLKGLEHVSTLYQYIISKKAIIINYQSFKARQPRPFAISPYLLKEYRNRWFVICYDYVRNGICNYALDRIVSIEPYEDKPFVGNTFFDPEHYFDNIVGVTKDLNSQAQTVKLKVDTNQAPYVITKPLHSTQKVVKKLEDGGIMVTIEVVPNQELERIILGFGQHMQVIEPRLLRHRIKKELQVAALQYDKAE
jgi:predicted DNA-binding transcriptional regulator YafY